MATRRPWPIHIASVIALALIYVATAQLGYSIGASTPHTLLLWAPSGIGLGAVIVFGSAIAPGIAIGAILTAFLFGHDVTASLVIGVVDMFEAVAAAYVLRELLDFHPALDRVRDVAALVGTALVITCFDAAIVTLGLVLVGWMPGSMLGVLSERWWWSHLGGDLIVTPLVITYLARGRLEPGRGDRHIERWVLTIAVIVASCSIFYPGFPDVLPGTPRAYQIFPLLLWAGVRFGPRGAALTSFVVGVMAIVGTALGDQELVHIANLQSFVSISSVTTLTLAALHAERVAVARRKSAIQGAVLDGILTLDREGRILEFNPAAEHMFGVGAAAMLGKDVARLLVPEQRSTPVTTSAAGQRLRLRALRPDGSTFPIELALTRVDLDDHDLFTAVVRDCTLEETSALALRESRDRLEDKVRERTAALVRSETMLKTSQRLAHIGSFEVVDGQLTCSDETLRIFGRDPETFKATVADFYAAIRDDDERALVKERIELARKTGGAFEIDNRIVRPDGTVRVIHTTAVALEGRVAGCCQDITERYQAQELKQRLIGIVESSEDAIIGVSLDAKIVSWNAAAERIFGYRPEQILGKEVGLLVAGDGTTSINERIVAIRAGQHLSHYELEHRRADGAFFAASVTMSVVRDADGKPIGFSKVLRDISRQKALEATTMASLREKEVLLREVHHRVKNNLQVISSLLNMQLERIPEADARRALIDSQNRIQSMALVHQQLYQSKDLARIDLLDYIQILVGRIATTYGLRPEQVATEVRGERLLVDIDRAIPSGLIVNELVTNAMTHGFPDGRSGKVVVDLSYTPSGARITVCDDGVGLPGAIKIDELKTFGLKIAEILTRQLAGTLTFSMTDGTCAALAFPLVAGN
jgi:PAS domain S-box-containing protein